MESYWSAIAAPATREAAIASVDSPQEAVDWVEEHARDLIIATGWKKEPIYHPQWNSVVRWLAGRDVREWESDVCGQLSVGLDRSTANDKLWGVVEAFAEDGHTQVELIETQGEGSITVHIDGDQVVFKDTGGGCEAILDGERVVLNKPSDAPFVALTGQVHD